MPSRQMKNPFVYGRILTSHDAACPRAGIESRIMQTVRDDGRLALVGDRRLGKSSVIARTLQLRDIAMLRLNFHEVLNLSDAVLRIVDEVERFVRERSPVARRVVPWLREIGFEMSELRSSMAGFEFKAAAMHTDHLKRAFSRIRDLSKRTQFALFIDELQDLQDRLEPKEAAAALAILRDEIQQLPRTPVFYAGSSRESFTLLFTSDASPFYEQAPLATVDPIPDREMLAFITAQFGHGAGIRPEAAELILKIAGDSPNDVQRLCYETWNEHVPATTMAGAADVQRGFDKILRDASSYCEHWLEGLSTKQLRVVFAVAFLDHLGASSREFLTFAGVHNPGDLPKSLASLMRGKEALIEKVGSRYRFRSRFARLWFALRYYRVQALIPAMRSEDQYRRYLRPLLPPLPADPLRPLP